MPRGDLKPLDVGSIPSYTQPLFRFPGSFHPPLVRSLIESHPEASIVGDPMAGCGTSALVSVSLGHNAIVSDIDPLACLLTRAKCTPIDPGHLIETVHGILDTIGPLGYRATVSVSPEDAIQEMERATPYRAPKDVFHWFHPTVARDMARVLLAFADSSRQLRPAQRDAVFAVIAATIRRVSRADPEPVSGVEVTSVRLERLRLGLRFDIRRELETRAAILADGYSQLLDLEHLGTVRVWQADARSWAQLCVNHNLLPDLQVTSPPYLNAINYARRHRLENVWLGLVGRDDYVAFGHGFLGVDLVRDIEITRQEGGLPSAVASVCERVRRVSSERTSMVLKQYFVDLSKWIDQVAKVANTSNGTAYVVVGASSLQGIHVDTPRIITSMAIDRGLDLLTSSKHRVVNHRMQYTLRKGRRVNSESVLCFRANN
jgi:hypothetical protein